MRIFKAPDGIVWGVEVDVPGSSNALVLFRHPAGENGRLDRYAWYIGHGPESRSVTSRLSPGKVLEALSDAQLRLLFRRSMPISKTGSPMVNVPLNRAL